MYLVSLSKLGVCSLFYSQPYFFLCSQLTIQGQLTFKDGLTFSEGDWDYCDEDDRRFYSERLHGVQPAGTLSPLLLWETSFNLSGGLSTLDGTCAPSYARSLAASRWSSSAALAARHL